MTMHHLTPRDEANADRIVVGYDPHTSSYFAKVSHSSDSHPKVWVGHNRIREITSARAIIEMVQPYAHIPRGLLTALHADHDEVAQRTEAERQEISHWSRDGRVPAW